MPGFDAVSACPVPMPRSDKLLLNTLFFVMYAQGIFFLHHILFRS